MTEGLDAAALAERVAPSLGASASSLRLSPISTGKHNSSYWVETPERRYVLRVAPHDAVGMLVLRAA